MDNFNLGLKKYIRLAKQSSLVDFYDFSKISGGGHISKDECDLTPMTIEEVIPEIQKYYTNSHVAVEKMTDAQYLALFHNLLPNNLKKKEIGSGSYNDVYSHTCPSEKGTDAFGVEVAYRISKQYVLRMLKNGLKRYISESNDNEITKDILKFIAETNIQIRLSNDGISPPIYMIGFLKNNIIKPESIQFFSFQQLMHPIQFFSAFLMIKAFDTIDSFSKHYLCMDIKPGNMLTDKPRMFSVYPPDTRVYIIDVDPIFIISDQLLLWAIDKSIKARPSIGAYLNIQSIDDEGIESKLYEIRANIMKYLLFIFSYFYYSFPSLITKNIYSNPNTDADTKQIVYDFLNIYSSDITLFILSYIVLYHIQNPEPKDFLYAGSKYAYDIVNSYHHFNMSDDDKFKCLNNDSTLQHAMVCKKIVDLPKLLKMSKFNDVMTADALNLLYPYYDFDMCDEEKYDDYMATTKATTKATASATAKSIFKFW